LSDTVGFNMQFLCQNEKLGQIKEVYEWKSNETSCKFKLKRSEVIKEVWCKHKKTKNVLKSVVLPTLNVSLSFISSSCMKYIYIKVECSSQFSPMLDENWYVQRVWLENGQERC